MVTVVVTDDTKSSVRPWWIKAGMISMLCVVTLTAVGCAHHISDTMRREADRTLSFAQLRADPEAFRDHTVILGGEILRCDNMQEGTLLEILQKPLDGYEKPQLTDLTEGRFMARCADYLDPAVYKRGREITIAGRVLGARKGRIGEGEYTYPLISCLEVYLWPETVRPLPYEPYPWWYWDSPWFWTPYYYPWRGRHR